MNKITTIILCFLSLALLSREAISLTKPANSFIYENNWYCYSGYQRLGNSCVVEEKEQEIKVTTENSKYVPPNAYLYGSRWICNLGYEQLGKKCIKISNIANSYQSNGKWYCDLGYEKMEGSCIKKGSYKRSNKKNSSGDSFADLVNAFFTGFNSVNSKSNSYDYDTPSYNSNSNKSTGFKTSFGNTYKYNLNDPLDQLKYKTDPAAQVFDNAGSQYIREMECKVLECGGGKKMNGGAVTWDWVN